MAVQLSKCRYLFMSVNVSAGRRMHILRQKIMIIVEKFSFVLAAAAGGLCKILVFPLARPASRRSRRPWGWIERSTGAARRRSALMDQGNELVDKLVTKQIPCPVAEFLFFFWRMHSLKSICQCTSHWDSSYPFSHRSTRRKRRRSAPTRRSMDSSSALPIFPSSYSGN